MRVWFELALVGVAILAIAKPKHAKRAWGHIRPIAKKHPVMAAAAAVVVLFEGMPFAAPSVAMLFLLVAAGAVGFQYVSKKL